MLPADARLRAPSQFRAAGRGRRGSSGTVVVQVLDTGKTAPSRAGFVVSKRVGNSVVRHRVVRRLRPLMRERLTSLPMGTDVVVRALPGAAAASSAALAADLDTALGAARRRRRR